MTKYTPQQIADWLDEMIRGQSKYDPEDVENLKEAMLLLQAADMPGTPLLRNGYLSPSFLLEEMIYSDTAAAQNINNNPSAQVVGQLSILCNDTLEKIRALCGNNPVIVSSGFR